MQCPNVQREKPTGHVVQLKTAPALIPCPSCSLLPASQDALVWRAMSATKEIVSISQIVQVQIVHSLALWLSNGSVVVAHSMYSTGCPSPPMFSGSPTVQPGVVMVSWTAAGSSDPRVTGIRYALYSQCGAETTFQLIDDDIQGLSYNITTLPTLTQCVLRVVVYSDHCLLYTNGLLVDTTDSFTTGERYL